MISPRKLLFVIPAFVAVGVAAACGPYIGPLCNQPAPTSPPSGISMPGPQTAQWPAPSTGRPTPCIPPPAPDTPPTQITAHAPRPRVVYEYPAGSGVPGTSLSVLDGKLLVQTVDGSRMACERFTILVSGAEPAEVAVAEKLVTITSGKQCPGLCCTPSGSSMDCLRASAQKVRRVGAEGATLVLEGGAKLVYVRGGKKIEVATELLQVNLLTGQVISEMELRPVQPIPSEVPTSVVPTEPQAAPKPSYPRGTAPETSTPGTEPAREPLTPAPRP